MKLQATKRKIIEAIKIKIDSDNIKTESLAKKLRVSRSYIPSLINGSKNATLDRLYDIADLVGVEISLIISI